MPHATTFEDRYEELQAVFRRCAAEKAALYRNVQLDEPTLDEACQEMLVFTWQRWGERRCENAWYLAHRAWSAVWRRVIPLGVRRGDVELSEEIEAHQDDSLTFWSVRRAISGMNEGERFIALALLRGERTTEAAKPSGAHWRKVQRVRDKLALAVA